MSRAFSSLVIGVLLAVSTSTRQQPARPLAVTHVDVIDVTGGPVKRDMTVLIANGVTGVRQMWGMPMHFNWRERARSGALLTPRLSIASTIVDGPNPVWPASMVVNDEVEARGAVRKIKETGFDFVKVYERLPRDAYFAIADEAKRLGIPFAGHVPRSISAIEAVERRSTQHRASDRCAVWDARAALRELNERVLATYDANKASALFTAFVRNGTWHCPTLVVLRSLASLDDPVFTSDPRLKYMPSSIRASWVPKNDFRLSTRSAEDYALDRRVFRKQLEVVGALRRAGVRLIAGTDVLNPFAFPGFSLHDELALLVEAGLTPLEALQAATVNAAA